MDYRLLLLPLTLLISACTTSSAVLLPSVKERQTIEETTQIDTLTLAMRIQPGDSLRIFRDARPIDEKDEVSIFTVSNDGSFAYPEVGKVQAEGKTVDAIASYISEKLALIYREPQVTVNIFGSVAGNIFVGGAVRNAGALPLQGTLYLEQAILGAGGVISSADSQHIALLRINEQKRYDVAFYNFADLLKPNSHSAPVVLQRGDIVFVPKSSTGNIAEGMDLYVNQLLPFSRAIGISYDVNDNND
jgi:hypothetical protein